MRDVLGVLPRRRMRPEIVRGALTEGDRGRGRRDPLRLGLTLASYRIDAIRQQLTDAPSAPTGLGQAKYESAAEAVVMLLAVELISALPMRVGATRDYEIESALIEVPAGLAPAQQLEHFLRRQTHGRILPVRYPAGKPPTQPAEVCG